MAARAALEVETTANTDRFVRKLRAISRHADALADELEAIDAAGSATGQPAEKGPADRMPWAGEA